jgi:prepilin-type N-terminal cleavage/methylation domain-containing protein
MNKLFKQAFTLIELLVVIAIIGILSGLIVITMSGVTQEATLAKAQVFSNSLKNSLLMNLVSEWKFDGITSDGSSAVADDVLDTWSKINNGTVSATPPTVKTGTNCVNGSCLQFNGSANYVDFGSDSSLSMGAGDATVSFWVEFDNATAPRSEILVECGARVGTSGYPGYRLFRYIGTSQLYGAFADGTTARVNDYLSTSGTLVASTWYNVVVVFTRASVAQAYINGVKQTGYSLNISGQPGNISNYESFKIGSDSSSSTRLAGKMDEVRIYNAAMATSQIKEQYYVGLNKLLVNGGITKKEYLFSVNEMALGN